jgi:hypothetical protein
VVFLIYGYIAMLMSCPGLKRPYQPDQHVEIRLFVKVSGASEALRFMPGAGIVERRHQDGRQHGAARAKVPLQIES